MTSYFYIVKIGAFENKLITKTNFFDTLADSHKTKIKMEKNQATSYNLMVKIETKCSLQKMRTPNTSLYQVLDYLPKQHWS
jgi:hypothetical protein